MTMKLLIISCMKIRIQNRRRPHLEVSRQSLAALSGLLLLASGQARSVTATGPTVQTGPLVTAAQAVLNQTNQGRACTTAEQRYYLIGASAASSTYRKNMFLTAHGLASKRQVTIGGLNYDSFRFKRDVPASANKGVYIPDGSTLLYCYGRWTVTAAKPTQGFQPPQGSRAVEATVVLTGAPAWLLADPRAVALTAFDDRGIAIELPTLNEYDKQQSASLTGPNRVWLPVNK